MQARAHLPHPRPARLLRVLKPLLWLALVLLALWGSLRLLELAEGDLRLVQAAPTAPAKA